MQATYHPQILMENLRCLTNQKPSSCALITGSVLAELSMYGSIGGQIPISCFFLSDRFLNGVDSRRPRYLYLCTPISSAARSRAMGSLSSRMLRHRARALIRLAKNDDQVRRLVDFGQGLPLVRRPTTNNQQLAVPEKVSAWGKLDGVHGFCAPCVD